MVLFFIDNLEDVTMPNDLRVDIDDMKDALVFLQDAQEKGLRVRACPVFALKMSTPCIIHNTPVGYKKLLEVFHLSPAGKVDLYTCLSTRFWDPSPRWWKEPIRAL